MVHGGGLIAVTRLRSSQRGALNVFDEPSTGLHPLDVATLVSVFDRLIDAERRLSTTTSACAPGTPGDVARDLGSVTGPWLAEYLGMPTVSR